MDLWVLLVEIRVAHEYESLFVRSSLPYWMAHGRQVAHLLIPIDVTFVCGQKSLANTPLS